MKLNGFIGPAYTLDDTEVDNQRAVNIFPEVIESKSGKGSQVAYYKSTPGLDEAYDLDYFDDNPSGPIRLVHYNKIDTTYIVAGQDLYVLKANQTISFDPSDVTAANDTIDYTAHGYWYGVKGQFTTTGTLPAGLSLSTDYFMTNMNLDQFEVASSLANAVAGTQIDITDQGTGTHTFTPTNDSYGMQASLISRAFTTSTGIIRAASSGDSTSKTTIFCDGTNAILYREPPISGVGVIYSLSSYGGQATATDVVFVDGYFITNKTDDNNFYVSDLDSYIFNALSFEGNIGDPDNIIGFAVNNRDLYIFNEQTTEVFVNTGNSDFPFERIQGGFIEQGCVSLGSISRIGGVAFWLGRNEFGNGVVYAMNGTTPRKISTHAIDQAIRGYADMSASTAYSYQDGGHNFYVLNFAEATWVYDLSTDLWHERAYTNAGTLERHRCNVGAFNPEIGEFILGDYADTKVFIYNNSTYDDNGDEITRLRVCPFISFENFRIFCARLWLDMKTGVGLVSGQGSDPQVMLDWSDDGGNTWSDEAWTSAGGQSGGIGEYSTRVYWNRLGAFRERIFRFKITDPVPVTLIDATMEIKKGGH